MNLDDQICYCYHVSMRKLVNFARRRRPKVASQMSDCLNAGTGCGWCVPILKKIHAAALAESCEEADNATRIESELVVAPDGTTREMTPTERLAQIVSDSIPDSDHYAENRDSYIKEKKPRNQY